MSRIHRADIELLLILNVRDAYCRFPSSIYHTFRILQVERDVANKRVDIFLYIASTWRGNSSITYRSLRENCSSNVAEMIKRNREKYLTRALTRYYEINTRYGNECETRFIARDLSLRVFLLYSVGMRRDAGDGHKENGDAGV